MPFSRAIIWRASKNSKLFLLMRSAPGLRPGRSGPTPCARSCARCLLLRGLLRSLRGAAELRRRPPFEDGPGPLDLVVAQPAPADDDPVVVGVDEGAGHAPLTVD